MKRCEVKKCSNDEHLEDVWESFWSNDTSVGGGDDGIRTRDLSLAKAALSHLSYIPLIAFYL